jgi:hypothetical protein
VDHFVGVWDGHFGLGKTRQGIWSLTMKSGQPKDDRGANGLQASDIDAV